MINHPCFSIEPWCLRATELDLELLGQIESVFALSNGHIGWRANLDEGEPHWLPGSYLNGVHELRTLPYAEPGYGYPESGQTIINVTNGKVIRLLVDDEPFDVTYGRAGRPRVAPGLPRRRTETPHRLDIAGRMRGAGVLDPAGVARAPVDRCDPLSGRGYRPTDAGGGAVRTCCQ